MEMSEFTQIMRRRDPGNRADRLRPLKGYKTEVWIGDIEYIRVFKVEANTWEQALEQVYDALEPIMDEQEKLNKIPSYEILPFELITLREVHGM